ncbi:hypothetical protein MKF01_09330 [Pasteurella multocida]|nr:hypothetical protein [Pasteurella multocida]
MRSRLNHTFLVWAWLAKQVWKAGAKRLQQVKEKEKLRSAFFCLLFPLHKQRKTNSLIGHPILFNLKKGSFPIIIDNTTLF